MVTITAFYARLQNCCGHLPLYLPWIFRQLRIKLSVQWEGVSGGCQNFQVVKMMSGLWSVVKRQSKLKSWSRWEFLNIYNRHTRTHWVNIIVKTNKHCESSNQEMSSISIWDDKAALESCWFDCESFPTSAYNYPSNDGDFIYLTGYRWQNFVFSFLRD